VYDLAIIAGNRVDKVQRLKVVIASQIKKLKNLGQLSAFVVGIVMMADDGGHILLGQQLDTTNTYVNEYVRQGRSVHVPIATTMHELGFALTEEPRDGWTLIWDIVGKIRYLADRTRHELQ
jgi:hypothetical protein